MAIKGQQTMYEFKVEYIDIHEDIIDSDFFNTFKEVVNHLKSLNGEVPHEGDHIDMCVVKDVFMDDGCLEDRDHCYLVHGGKVCDEIVFDKSGDSLPKVISRQITL